MSGSKIYSVAVCGATGLVGRTMVKVLEERNFPVSELLLFASQRSAGKKIKFKGEDIEVRDINTSDFSKIDFSLFSAGKEVSIQYVPLAANAGSIAIDNGSYWRMDPDVPLVVPEVNQEEALKHNGIIANPNCSTIQLVVALKPIHDIYTLKRVVVSTYQSVSGAGQKGVDKLITETKKYLSVDADSKENYQFAFNTAFHEIEDISGNSIEEIKMINEVRKIMNLNSLPITATCVRLPLLGGHGESVNVETEKPIDINELRKILSESKGIILIDEPLSNKYPTVHISANTDPVYIGRIRKDSSVNNGINLWIVADNLRKGAATNAVQIAETLI